jgi:hypothetical protein
MKFHLSLAVVFGILGATAFDAQAGCGVGDFVCEKFSRKSETRETTRRRPTVTRYRRREQQAVVRAPVAPDPVNAGAADSTRQKIESVKTSMIQASPPPVELSRLQPGAIQEAPKDLTSLIFGSDEQIEVATAQCKPVERSIRRITCQVAVSRLALTAGEGAGCTAQLAQRSLEFVKNEDGAWVNDDAISLCGGRLLRKAELLPVSINGSRRYAFSEEYEMLGGDKKCAAPYLQSRYPLRKTYMPGSRSEVQKLNCGTVAAR